MRIPLGGVKRPETENQGHSNCVEIIQMMILFAGKAVICLFNPFHPYSFRAAGN